MADHLNLGPIPGGLKKWIPFTKTPATILFLMVLGFSFKREDSSEIVRYSSVIL